MFLSKFNVCLLSFLDVSGSVGFNYRLFTRQIVTTVLTCAKNASALTGENNRQRSTKMPGESFVLKFSKLTEKAFEPSRGSEYAAGFDLKSAYDYVVKAHGKELIKTDLQVQIPEGCYGRIAPRSGLAWKNFIDVGAGVIDADYRGNVGVVIFNHGDTEFIIKEGDRIAQLICEKIAYPSLEEVKNMDNTTRGSGGFGSTGKN